MTKINDIEVLELASLKDTMRRLNWELWKKAIEKNLVTLKKAKIWELVDVPISINIIGYKWVFKAKKNIAENIVYYKTCLVTQGFSQVPGIDYFNTYISIV